MKKKTKIVPRLGPPTNVRPAGAHKDRKAHELARLAKQEAMEQDG